MHRLQAYTSILFFFKEKKKKEEDTRGNITKLANYSVIITFLRHKDSNWRKLTKTMRYDAALRSDC